jgi:hypothetical protein
MITRREVPDARPDLFHHASPFVSEHDRERRGQVPLKDGEVRSTDARRDHPETYLTRQRPRGVELLDPKLADTATHSSLHRETCNEATRGRNQRAGESLPGEGSLQAAAEALETRAVARKRSEPATLCLVFIFTNNCYSID